MRLVIVTGMSGAGKSTAMKMMEDMGFFCIDNLPIPLLDKLVDVSAISGHEIHFAVVARTIVEQRSLCLEPLAQQFHEHFVLQETSQILAYIEGFGGYESVVNDVYFGGGLFHQLQLVVEARQVIEQIRFMQIVHELARCRYARHRHLTGDVIGRKRVAEIGQQIQGYVVQISYVAYVMALGHVFPYYGVEQCGEIAACDAAHVDGFRITAVAQVVVGNHGGFGILCAVAISVHALPFHCLQ